MNQPIQELRGGIISDGHMNKISFGHSGDKRIPRDHLPIEELPDRKFLLFPNGAMKSLDEKCKRVSKPKATTLYDHSLPHMTGPPSMSESLLFGTAKKGDKVLRSSASRHIKKSPPSELIFPHTLAPVKYDEVEKWYDGDLDGEKQVDSHDINKVVPQAKHSTAKVLAAVVSKLDRIRLSDTRKAMHGTTPAPSSNLVEMAPVGRNLLLPSNGARIRQVFGDKDLYEIEPNFFNIDEVFRKPHELFDNDNEDSKSATLNGTGSADSEDSWKDYNEEDISYFANEFEMMSIPRLIRQCEYDDVDAFGLNRYLSIALLLEKMQKGWASRYLQELDYDDIYRFCIDYGIQSFDLFESCELLAAAIIKRL